MVLAGAHSAPLVERMEVRHVGYRLLRRAMPRLVFGSALCCAFFFAQAHVQHQRLERVERLTAASMSRVEQAREAPYTEHLGTGATRALKAGSAQAQVEGSLHRAFVHPIPVASWGSPATPGSEPRASFGEAPERLPLRI